MKTGLKPLRSQIPVKILTAGIAVMSALTLSSLLPGLLSGMGSSPLDTVLAQQGPMNDQVIRGSGLSVPRYVSLKSDRINIRNGPGLDHKILWVFRRAGLPVEVVKEFHGWRQIRDAEGSKGWVLGAMLSGRRTALVLPEERKAGRRRHVKLYRSDTTSSASVAKVEAGVLANVMGCTGTWCEVTVGRLRGHIEQKNLWGIYPDERVK